MPETCALDVADEGPHTLLELGGLLRMTREGVRQIAVSALQHLAERRSLVHLAYASPAERRELVAMGGAAMGAVASC